MLPPELQRQKDAVKCAVVGLIVFLEFWHLFLGPLAMVIKRGSKKNRKTAGFSFHPN